MSTSSFAKFTGATVMALCLISKLPAADILLQKVPQTAELKPRSETSQAPLGPQATFALINYSVLNSRNKARAVYVSSGDDISMASSMIDSKAATSFGFSADDPSPTAVIDLGRICTVRRLSVTYSAHPGSMDFYVMRSLPTNGDENPESVSLDGNAVAKIGQAGSLIDDGTKGHALLNIPAKTGRYVMMKWTPASRADGTFSVAEVSAADGSGNNLLASNVNFSSAPTADRTAARHSTAGRTGDVDSKDVADSKDVLESKDIPAEGPSSPPPALPDTPTFGFIPQVELVPITPVINPLSF